MTGGPPAPARVLVLRASALGDVVLATSVLDPLRAACPGARIEWVTSPGCAPLLEGLPQLDAVHVLGPGLAGARALAARLSRRFDLAVDLQHKARTWLVARAAAPRRLTFRRRGAGAALLALLALDRPLAGAHATALYAEALAPLGVRGPGPLHVHLGAAARARAAEALAGVRRPVVAVAPGARWATKRWPPERFAAVADALAAQGASVALAGGPGDEAALGAVRARLRAPVAADFSSLPVDALAAALAGVDLLVACDSGPAHLAAAVGTPALVLFGPTSPARWGPPPPGRALTLGLACAPCSNHGGPACPRGHHRCLAELSAAAVVAAARPLLARARPEAPEHVGGRAAPR